jgi:hypothetical protein
MKIKFHISLVLLALCSTNGVSVAFGQGAMAGSGSTQSTPPASTSPSNPGINLTVSPEKLTIKIIVPGTTKPTGAKGQEIDVPAKKLVYKTTVGVVIHGVSTPSGHGDLSIPAGHIEWMAAFQDPHTQKSYIVPFPCDFCIADNAVITSFDASGGVLVWYRSYFDMPESAGNLDATIKQFAAISDDEKVEMVRMDALRSNRVQLWAAATPPFFSPDPVGAVSYRVNGIISSIDVTDGILRLDMLSPRRDLKGSFWIDIKASKIITSTVDGEEMDLSGQGYAKPLKKN